MDFHIFTPHISAMGLSKMFRCQETTGYHRSAQVQGMKLM